MEKILDAECVAGSQLSQLALEGTTVSHIPYMGITGLVSKLWATPLHIKKAWLKKGRLLGGFEECTGTSRAGWLSVQ